MSNSESEKHFLCDNGNDDDTSNVLRVSFLRLVQSFSRKRPQEELIYIFLIQFLILTQKLSEISFIKLWRMGGSVKTRYERIEILNS